MIVSRVYTLFSIQSCRCELTIALRAATENIPTLPSASLVGFETDARRDCKQRRFTAMLSFIIQAHLRIW